MLYHLDVGSVGFVALDVFFVLSGYLITAHLITDLARSSHVGTYVGDFYRRRIRKLLPSLLVTIIATLAIAHVLFSAARYQATLTDTWWVAVFAANWHFVDVSTDYFSAQAPESPLQHTWSLSLEEQFYVVWPLVVFALALLFGARRAGSIHRRRLAAGTAAVALISLSLVYAFQQSRLDPSAAYFSTFSRGWELGVGAILACIVPYLRVSRWTLTTMSWAGMALFTYSSMTLDSGPGFPAPGAILPCLGAALIIGATSGGGTGWNPILSNPVAVFLGDISYPLYLVHFPAIIFVASEIAERNAYYYTVASLLVFGLGAVLHALVERPILDSRWLLPRHQRDGVRRRSKLRPTLAMGAAVAVAGLAAYSVWPGKQAAAVADYERILTALDTSSSPVGTQSPVGPQSPVGTRSPAPSGGRSPAATPALDELQDQIAAALRATSWPELNPSFDEVTTARPDPPDVTACAVMQADPPVCTWGDPHAPHTIFVVGDSTAVAYENTFKHILNDLPGWNLRGAAAFGCLFSSQVKENLRGSNPRGCAARNAAAVADIRATRPDILVITNILVLPPLDTFVIAEIEAVRSAVGHVVLLGAPPIGKNPQVCATPRSSPIDCVTTVSATEVASVATLEDVATQTGATFISGLPFFCAGNFCPSFVDHIPTKFDEGHMVTAYGVHLAPAVLEALRNASLF